MKVAVIGSGQAAISAAQALVARGVTPTILDVGETLAPEIQDKVSALARQSPGEWGDAGVQFAAPRTGARDLPRKSVFGSEYIFAENRPIAPVDRTGTTAVPSFAKGGFSMGWGATVLPARNEDLADWPSAARNLDRHYAAALTSMPLAAGADGLAERFPLYGVSPTDPPISDQGRRLRQNLERALPRINRGRDTVVFGTARLAVNMAECVRCGMCLTGCPYGLIHLVDRELDRMIVAGSVRYCRDAYVIALTETGDQVRIDWLDTKFEAARSETFDRVYLGAGALGSARIVLNSLRAYDKPVRVKDSAKFALPLIRLTGARFEWPSVNTLADLFIEAVFQDISPHWLHAQISPLNDMMLRALHMLRGGELNLLGKLARPLTSRLMVAWCGMHSEMSSECTLSVSPGNDGRPVLAIKAGPDRSAPFVRAYGWAMASLGLRARTLVATPAAMVSPVGSTGHCGGSFPMQAQPRQWYETDILGRLQDWRRIHLIDAAAFPSIPGTTIALLIRANARRIVAETDWND